MGLYAVCHEMVYGVLPEELEEVRLFKLAAREASKLVRVSFQGDVDAAVEFTKWVWFREKGRVQWAASQSPPRERGRLGWRLSFSEAFVTDYRVALVSKRRGSREQRGAASSGSGAAGAGEARGDSLRHHQRTGAD